MTRAIYIVGEPGAGKTTTVQTYLQQYDKQPAIRLHRQLWAEPLIHDDKLTGFHLGKTKDTFSGTDALGMAVNPDAITWLQTAHLPPFIIGEGQRLANQHFITQLNQRTQLTLIHLTANNAAQRRQTRGTNQNPTWIKAAISRATNITNLATQQGRHVTELNTQHLTPQQAAENLQQIIGIINT